jgi:hypothetical protein
VALASGFESAMLSVETEKDKKNSQAFIESLMGIITKKTKDQLVACILKVCHRLCGPSRAHPISFVHLLSLLPHLLLNTIFVPSVFVLDKTLTISAANREHASPIGVSDRP